MIAVTDVAFPLKLTPFKYTRTFAKLPSASTINDSEIAASLWEAAHTGSASIRRRFDLGALPTYFTRPETSPANKVVTAKLPIIEKVNILRIFILLIKYDHNI